MNDEIKLTNFLKWVSQQEGTIESPVRTYVERLFNGRRVSNVSVWPEEIRIGFRYAHTESYTPDAGLAEMIGRLKAKRTWTAEEILALDEEARAA